jgi:hypothetical protein
MVYKSADGWGRNFEDKPVATTIKLFAIVLAVGFVFTAVIWGVGSGFSYWWGRGGAVQEKNSTSNFISAQAQFHRDLNAIEADRTKIQGAQASLDQWNQQHPNFQGNGTPYDPLAQQQANDQEALQGLQMGCANEAADYNTAAQSYLSADWRDAGLPDHLDPAAVCDPKIPLPTG